LPPLGSISSVLPPPLQTSAGSLPPLSSLPPLTLPPLIRDGAKTGDPSTAARKSHLSPQISRSLFGLGGGDKDKT